MSSTTAALFLFLALALAAPRARAQPWVPPSDFVVLGGGTAGCAVAATVCQGLRRATVTVIERGSPRSPRARRRTLAARLLTAAWNDNDPELLQRFRTTKNAGLRGRSVAVLLGANIGGSSAVNAAKITMPPPWYYASLGIVGLNAASSERLFNRVKSVLRPIQPPPALRADYADTWIAAAGRAGFPLLAKPYVGGRSNKGAWPPRAAFDNVGRRSDSFRGFLKPAMDGPCKGRVRIVRGATVRRVLFSGNRAVSAEIQYKNGAVRVVRARREVLLAAGAVMSSTVLQRSGVGPRWLLNRLKIPVKADLPVGTRLQTRTASIVSSSYTSKLARESSVSLYRQPWVTRTFDAGRGGPLGISPYGPNVRLPGFGYLGMRIGFETAPPGQDGLKRIETTCLTNAGWNTFSTVRIRSRNATEPPELDLKLLNKREDLQRAMDLTRNARAVLAQLAKPMGARPLFFRRTHTLASVATKAGFERFVRDITYGTNHFAGGCEVGGVLDGKLRVRKLKGLRVVDSGAMRRVPINAGPLASVYIVAVRAGEIIVEDNGDLRK